MKSESIQSQTGVHSISKSILDNVPDALKKRLEGATLSRVKEGESDAVVYRVQSETIRYLKVSSHSAQYPARADYRRLQWLAGKIAVPQILHYAEDDHQQYLLMSNCAGLHPFHDDLKWTISERLAFLAQAAKAFHALAVLECPYRISFDDQIALARHNIEHDLVRADRLIDENKGRSIEDLFAEFVSLKPTKEDWAVTHGDLYPINIRVDETNYQVTGYIDVGTMAVADRYTDFAPIVNAIGWHYGKSWIAQFFTAYKIALNPQKLRFYQIYQEFL